MKGCILKFVFSQLWIWWMGGGVWRGVFGCWYCSRMWGGWFRFLRHFVYLLNVSEMLLIHPIVLKNHQDQKILPNFTLTCSCNLLCHCFFFFFFTQYHCRYTNVTWIPIYWRSLHSFYLNKLQWMKICSVLAHLFNNLSNLFKLGMLIFGTKTKYLQAEHNTSSWWMPQVISYWRVDWEFYKLHFGDNTIYSWWNFCPSHGLHVFHLEVDYPIRLVGQLSFLNVKTLFVRII